MSQIVNFYKILQKIAEKFGHVKKKQYLCSRFSPLRVNTHMRERINLLLTNKINNLLAW